MCMVFGLGLYMKRDVFKVLQAHSRHKISEGPPGFFRPDAKLTALHCYRRWSLRGLDFRIYKVEGLKNM